MVQNLILHLGDHKTGSTAIQTVLKQGAYSLSQGSLHYSSPGLNNNALAEPMMGRAPDPARAGPLWAERGRDLDASDARWGVLSAEHFENVAPEDLERVIERHLPQYRDRLRLIAYVRPHADRFLSSFAELAKLGQDVLPMDAFLTQARRNGMLSYAPRLARWQAVFGARFHVRPFVRERLAGGDVVRDFLGFVTGPDTEVRLAGEIRRNESLSLEDLALMIHLQRRIAAVLKGRPKLRHAVRHAVGWHVAPLLNAQPGAVRTAPRLHRSIAEHIIATCRADAVETDRQWFTGTPLTDAMDRALETTVEAPQGFALEDHFGAAERRLIGIWAEVLVRQAAADPEQFTRAIRASGPRGGTGGRGRLPPGRNSGEPGGIVTALSLRVRRILSLVRTAARQRILGPRRSARPSRKPDP